MSDHGKNKENVRKYSLALATRFTFLSVFFQLLGEILVSVCHLATTGILRIGVIRAMGLARTMRKTMGGG